MPPGKAGDLKGFLPPEVVSDLASFVEAKERWLLLLDPSLPENWQLFLWEAATFAGERVDSLAVVVRCAADRFVATETIGDALLPPAWLNLFPPGEFSFPKAFAAEIDGGLLRRVSPSHPIANAQSSRDLIILAHGNGGGLLDRTGNSFELPVAALPQRVWLLACNVDGGMWRLAFRSLELGVQTVVTLTDELSAPEMAELVRAWVARGGDFDPGTWLLARRGAIAAAGECMP